MVLLPVKHLFICHVLFDCLLSLNSATISYYRNIQNPIFKSRRHIFFSWIKHSSSKTFSKTKEKQKRKHKKYCFQRYVDVIQFVCSYLIKTRTKIIKTKQKLQINRTNSFYSYIKYIVIQVYNIAKYWELKL